MSLLSSYDLSCLPIKLLSQEEAELDRGTDSSRLRAQNVRMHAGPNITVNVLKLRHSQGPPAYTLLLLEKVELDGGIMHEWLPDVVKVGTHRFERFFHNPVSHMQ